MTKLFVCGDIIHNNTGFPFIGEKLSKLIQDADFSIGNLEGVELNNNSAFKTPSQSPGTIDYLQSIGFDMMLLANNHITDHGLSLFKETITKIKNNKLSYIGAGCSWEEVYEADCIETINGIRLGFVNVCEAQVGQYLERNQDFGYAWMGYDGLYDKIKRLSKIVDYVIVFVHAGLEHYDLPLPEIRYFYKKLCDAGACCVIGGHPHVVQGYEFYKNSVIAYSLGNFYYPHPFGEYPNESCAFSLLIKIEKDEPIRIETIHHKMEHGVVEVIEKNLSSIDETRLCLKLGDGYEELAEEMCVNAYDKLCRKLLVDALCGEVDNLSFSGQLKNVLRRTVFRKQFVYLTREYRDSLLLRLIENESYRYTIIRALKAKQKLAV
ncbi:MAG: CapA family protein [Prevotella sp.]|nr:CapA family protein [Prevotella sp.]